MTNRIEKDDSKSHGGVSVVGRGRKPLSESRAVEMRARLATWKRTREQGRISLRALAGELGTSHQLLSYYLKQEAKSGKLPGLEKYVEELCKAGHGKEAVELLKLAN